MESAIHDLVRELSDSERLRRPELEVDVELELAAVEPRAQPVFALPDEEDELLLDPWFFRTEEEIAAIDDDPTAKIIEIRIGGYAPTEYDSRWLESA